MPHRGVAVLTTKLSIGFDGSFLWLAQHYHTLLKQKAHLIFVFIIGFPELYTNTRVGGCHMNYLADITYIRPTPPGVRLLGIARSGAA